MKIISLRQGLLGTAGGALAMVLASGASAAQSPSAAMPGTGVATQVSPVQGAPEQTTPDPAVVAQPEGPESRNQTGEPVTDDGSEVEAVVVTGSRIRRDPTNAPAALIQIGRDEILQSGEPNVVDFLADIPALQSSQVPEDTTGSNLNDGGLSLLDLRNLGSLRTLVLVDGRRHVGASQGDLRVDVDSIPSLLVENVEVVTGGQSALYGADAVSGVVNFILRRNFEGIEVDAAVAQINQDGELNQRISGLIGENLLDGRLNVYAFGEYQKSDEVLDLDIDFFRDAVAAFTDDVDPNGLTPDDVTDVRLVRNVRNISRARGGLLTLLNQPLPSPANDRDTPIQVCPAISPTTNFGTTQISTNCTATRAEQPFRYFLFNADGTARSPNFGTDQAGSGFSRANNVGGDGLNPNTEFSQGSRLPESEAFRFQTGVNFNVTDDLQLYGEFKYVREETFDSGQSTFFNIGIVPLTPGQTPTLFSSSTFNIGLDNAFLPPAVRTAILANTRPQINAAGVQTGTVADPRAQFTPFGPSRFQFNERELLRYVVGARGDHDQLGFIRGISYEVGYTYGKVESTNSENGVDVERFQLALDAVRNASGQIVCRAQDLMARGVAVPNQNLGGNYAANDPTITGCTPLNLFGADLRIDANEDNITGGGSRPGATQAQLDYILASIEVDDRNEQHNLLAFASGDLGEDFIGAGPIGVAVGYEYRKDITASSGRDRDTAGRLLFLNSGPPFPETEADVTEFFTEVNVPLLRNSRFGRNLEVSGAYRTSDYSTVGKIETYSLQGQYRPVRDIGFRLTYGEATRIPTLNDLYNPGGQTFGNSLLDPCDSVQLASAAVPAAEQANRRANCVTLLGAGYDPNSTRIVYGSGVPGSSGGNLDLKPEDSRSYTFGAVFTPRFIPRFSLVLDYYDIKISNVIVTPTVQQNLNGCVAGAVLNTIACSVLVRNGQTGDAIQPVPFGLRDFDLIPLNFAARVAKGMDITARYSIDTADLIGRNLGRFDYSLRANYLIRNEDFENISDPSNATENDSMVGSPRVRTLSTLTYSPRDNISVTWDWDFQSSQELRDSDLLVQDPDSRPASFLETGAFHQHDFSLRYEVLSGVTLRAGVVNAFDAEPPEVLQAGFADVRGGGQNVLQLGDNFDFFGRRFYVGANLKLGRARD